MKKIVNFTEVRIKNFKSIKDKVFHLGKLNDIYGANKTGKSSVLEAIQFCCKGGKNDVDKIKVGEDKAEVEISAKENKVDFYVKTTIDRDGKVYCTAKSNGVTHNQPRSLIERVLSFGSFNPRMMLEKKGRLERLLKLVPVFIKKEDLKIPEIKVLDIPISDPNAINFEAHAFEVLQGVEKDLRNTRLTKGREKDLLIKAYTQRKDDLESSCITFQKNYNDDPLKAEMSVEEESREDGRALSDLKKFEEHKQKALEGESFLRDKKEKAHLSLSTTNDNLKIAEEKAREYQREALDLAKKEKSRRTKYC